jgi:hypothetical protein
VIHTRRTTRNLVAIEVKTSASSGLDRDREKLRNYLAEPHLKYAFAILVTYRNGEARFDPIDRIVA